MSRFVFYVFLAALGSAALAQGQDCNTDTGGSCNIFGCSAQRGPTVCAKVSFWSHKCLCQEGYCVVGGICKSAADTPAPAPPPAPLPTPPAPTPAPTQPSMDDDTCSQAYNRGCYAQTPFKSCCNDGQCRSGGEDITCSWGFELPCCKNIFNATKTQFTFDKGSEDFCRKACVILGDKHNSHLDYCPLGKLMENEHVKGCQAARTSLSQAVGDPSWCSSHHTMTCKWSYRMFNKNQGEQGISGQFDFNTDDASCTEACVALGSPTNKPAYYCPKQTPEFVTSVSKCPAAKASFNTANAKWCGEERDVSLAQAVGRHEIITAAQDPRPAAAAAARASAANRSLPSSVASSDELDELDFNDFCHTAFQKGCWKEKPFIDCCGQCAQASASFACHWRYKYGDQPAINGTLRAFGTEPWNGCEQACKILANESNEPDWYCHFDTSPLMPRIAICKQANLSLTQTSEHLRTTKSILCNIGNSTTEFLSSPGQSRFDLVVGTAVAAVALATAAAITVKIRSRPRVGQEGYQPFLG